MKKILKEYDRKKSTIRKRLNEFKAAQKKSEKDVFAELCFCILTPQSKAIYCDKAIRNLKESDSLFKGKAGTIRKTLKGLARFHNKKADYIVVARKILKDTNGISIKKRINEKDILGTREWLVKSIKGIGYKEASHFLRNIGFGKNVAILDRHILKNLAKLGVLKNVPTTITKRTYLEAEEKMRNFAREIGITLEELDLLFWSLETGYVFK